MARPQETPVGAGEAWTHTMQGFTHAATELVGQAMHWQQDLVRLWVDTQQQLAGFWMRSPEEATRAAGAGQAGERGAARGRRQ